MQPPKKTVERSEKGEEAVRLRYSPVDVLRKKDFADCTPEEFAELHRLMADLNLSGELRRSRRLGPAPRGRRDASRTLRDALRTGGEPLRHRYRKARDQPRRVVLLCDVSGSMASYSRALLRFMHASVASGEPVEAFVLGTRLTRVTRELADRDPDRALGEASRAVEDWSGGTRLGDTIKEFVDRWGQRGMARGAVVVILSDGWDRGDVAVLAEQMSRIAATRPQGHLGQPPQGRTRLPTSGQGHGRRAPARGRVPLGPQLRVPGRARPRHLRRSRKREIE